MKKQFEGKLVRFDRSGIGVVDVSEIGEYVYFTPMQIDGYVGQTVEELKSPKHGSWVDGKTVIILGDVGVSGNVHVGSVKLKL